ncbi:MAG: aromatic ring-hydroxylating oxygenase subunit alpha, partial [Candidatus Binatia bacterium]
MEGLLDDPTVVQRIFDHIDHRTTDLAEGSWREPVANYRSAARFEAEVALLRRVPVAFCASAALPTAGSYVAREALGASLVAVRGTDGRVRAFRNACRHRGTELVGGSGCAKAFVCRYHAWTYGLDGRLITAPRGNREGGIPKEELGLVALRLETWGPLLFVN